MELELVYNEETKEWEQKKEPFITIEVETEEDFEFIGSAIAFYKKHLSEKEKPKTNADRIRAMSDEELAKWIDWLFGRCEWCDTDKMAADECNDVECTPCILEWLKQPAEV